VEGGLRRLGVTVSGPILALICIFLGVLVIAYPHLLQWVVGLFLIVQGALVLVEYLGQTK